MASGFAASTKLYTDAPSPLQEFSVVYTDRALNHMAAPFQKVMLDMRDVLKHAYQAESAVIVPGAGTYGMEAVARQFATKKKVLVVRNGYFSFRWSQIFEQCDIPSDHTVLKARPVSHISGKAQYAPPAIEEVVATIMKEKPAVVFAPHVETSTGIILPNDYIKQMADAAHSVGGLIVIDAIAAGTVWTKMKDLDVDVVVSAPQKGWSGPACAGLVMLGPRGVEATRKSQSTSFSINLRRWLEVMDKYEAGAFDYHATMPTDALRKARDAMRETEALGYVAAEKAAWELGGNVRQIMKDKGLVSVAAPGFEAPGVVVVHVDDPAVRDKFAAAGVQIAAGVPFMIDEPAGTSTFRIGLFGLDKLQQIAATTSNFRNAIDAAVPSSKL